MKKTIKVKSEKVEEEYLSFWKKLRFHKIYFFSLFVFSISSIKLLCCGPSGFNS